jgi:hypothetical protein
MGMKRHPYITADDLFAAHCVGLICSEGIKDRDERRRAYHGAVREHLKNL